MKLIEAEVEGYRSIRERLTFFVDRRVTVLLGANDHGKSNLLAALLHLNREAKFDKARDLNWDCEDRADDFPEIAGEFSLDDDERSLILELENRFRRLRASQTQAEEALLSRDEAAAVADELAAAVSELEAAAEQHEDENPVSATAEEVESEIPYVLPGLAEAQLAAAKAAEFLAEQQMEFDLLNGYRIEEETRLEALNEGNLEQILASAEAGVQAAEEQAATLRQRQSDLAAELAQAEGDPAKIEELTPAVEEATAANSEGGQLLERLLRNRADLRRAAEAREELGALSTRFPLDPGLLDIAAIPQELVLRRKGVEGEIIAEHGTPLFEEVKGALLDRVPRVELIRPVEGIPDAATAADLGSEDQGGFMRGIFFYAGLPQDEWDDLFQQTHATSYRLEQASAVLNQTLRRHWTQGSHLTFELRHDSATKEIQLLISDPSIIKSAFARPSSKVMDSRTSPH